MQDSVSKQTFINKAIICNSIKNALTRRNTLEWNNYADVNEDQNQDQDTVERWGWSCHRNDILDLQSYTPIQYIHCSYCGSYIFSNITVDLSKMNPIPQVLFTLICKCGYSYLLN